MHLRALKLHPERFPARDVYPFHLRVFQHEMTLDLETPITFWVGENGTGKSTLLRALARACDIHIWEDVEAPRYTYNPLAGELYRALSLEWVSGPVPGSFFGSDIFTFFSQNLDDWALSDPGQLNYFGGRSLTTLSHGQSLMTYFKARYRIEGLYLLDEPETALSPATQLELLKLLEELASEGKAQFIIATHSPILMTCPGARLYSFDQTPIRQADYRETRHYQVYRDFFRCQE